MLTKLEIQNHFLEVRVQQFLGELGAVLFALEQFFPGQLSVLFSLSVESALGPVLNHSLDLLL